MCFLFIISRDFVQVGLQKGPLLKQMVGADMHKRVGSRRIAVGELRGFLGKWRPHWADLPMEDGGTLILAGIFINLSCYMPCNSPPYPLPFPIMKSSIKPLTNTLEYELPFG